MDDSVPDLQRKYKGTYVWYGKELVWIKTFDVQHNNNDDEQTVIYYSTGNKENVVPFIQKDLEEIHCNSCFINLATLTEKSKPISGAKLFYKKPFRQWKRSLCPEICTISSPLVTLYASFGLSRPWEDKGLTYKFTHSLIKPVYPTLDEAMRLLPTMGAIAIGPLHCITLSPIDQNPLLMSLFGFIGELDGKRQTITIHHKPAIQETIDFVHRTHQTGWRVSA